MCTLSAYHRAVVSAFKQLASLRANTPASNTMVKMFDTPAAAISAIGASTLDRRGDGVFFLTGEQKALFSYPMPATSG